MSEERAKIVRYINECASHAAELADGISVDDFEVTLEEYQAIKHCVLSALCWNLEHGHGS